MNYINHAQRWLGVRDRWSTWSAMGLCFVLSGALLSGQTQVDLRNQTKRVDFTQAPTTAPVKAGLTQPANCNVGELFYKINAAAGANLYGCTTPNNWTLLGDGNSGIFVQKTGTGTPNGFQSCPTPSASSRTVYFDTAAQETWECVGTNTWKKILDTTGTGPVFVSGTFNPTNLTEPITPGGGAMQFGDHGLEYFPAGGALSRTVVPKNCGALSAGDFVSAIAIDGTVTCGTPTAVRAVDTQTAVIDSVASGNLLAGAPTGLYRVSSYVHTTAAEGAACLLNIDISYTYNGGSKTLRVVSNHDLNSDETASDSVRAIRVDNGTNILRSLTDTCTRSTYTFDYSIGLEKIN
jgi:hypothetical protein